MKMKMKKKKRGKNSDKSSSNEQQQRQQCNVRHQIINASPTFGVEMATERKKLKVERHTHTHTLILINQLLLSFSLPCVSSFSLFLLSCPKWNQSAAMLIFELIILQQQKSLSHWKNRMQWSTPSGEVVLVLRLLPIQIGGFSCQGSSEQWQPINHRSIVVSKRFVSACVGGFSLLQTLISLHAQLTFVCPQIKCWKWYLTKKNW